MTPFIPQQFLGAALGGTWNKTNSAESYSAIFTRDTYAPLKAFLDRYCIPHESQPIGKFYKVALGQSLSGLIDLEANIKEETGIPLKEHIYGKDSKSRVL